MIDNDVSTGFFDQDVFTRILKQAPPPPFLAQYQKQIPETDLSAYLTALGIRILIKSEGTNSKFSVYSRCTTRNF